MYSSGPLYMDGQRQDERLEPTYNSSVPIQDVALKTSRERWMIERGGGKESGRSALVVRPDDHDDGTGCYTKVKETYLQHYFPTAVEGLVAKCMSTLCNANYLFQNLNSCGLFNDSCESLRPIRWNWTGTSRC